MQSFNFLIMSAMASQITSGSIVYSTVCSGADQGKHESSFSLAFVRGIPGWPVDSPHKGPVTRKMFPLDDVIMAMSWGGCYENANGKKMTTFTFQNVHVLHIPTRLSQAPQRTYDVIITLSLSQNDVTTSFWRNNGVIITVYVHWDGCEIVSIIIRSDLVISR